MTDGEGGGERIVSREQARSMLAGGAAIVDVRVAHEWDAGHIAGARHLPLEELPARSDELDRDSPVILYCRGGSRSSMAAEALAGAGFDAVKLGEGIVGWEGAGLPIEPDGGYVSESGEAAAILESRRRSGPVPGE